MRQNRKQNLSGRSNDKGSSAYSLTSGRMVVAGTHAIRECLRVNPRHIISVFLSNMSNHELSKEIAEVSSKNKFTVEEKSKAFLDQIYPGHQNVLLIVKERPEFDFNLKKKSSLVIYLDGVEDPHNLGAILRTSWLMGADAIFIPENRAVSLTATAHKVASGGAEHVPVVSEVNFKSSIEKFKHDGYWVYGLSHKAKSQVANVQLPEKCVLVLGAEDKGIRSTSETFCDDLVSIPQVSASASYNVSVAAALVMYEWARQIKK